MSAGKINKNQCYKNVEKRQEENLEGASDKYSQHNPHIASHEMYISHNKPDAFALLLFPDSETSLRLIISEIVRYEDKLQWPRNVFGFSKTIVRKSFIPINIWRVKLKQDPSESANTYFFGLAGNCQMKP
jgi:hypothetical protein